MGIRRGIKSSVGALGMALTLMLTSCSSVAQHESSVRLAEPIVIRVLSSGVVAIATSTTGNPLVGRAAGGLAQVIGTFAFEQLNTQIFADEASFVIIHHMVDGTPQTSVIRIEDTGNLGIHVKGEVDIYPFEDHRITFDALKYEEAEITVFNIDSGLAGFSEGVVKLPAMGQAYDLETGSYFQVDDLELMPNLVDLYFDDSEKYGRLVNDAAAAARHGVPGSLEMCTSLPDETWRPNLVSSGAEEVAEAWCVRTSEGAYGFIEVVDGNLSYILWSEVQ